MTQRMRMHVTRQTPQNSDSLHNAPHAAGREPRLAPRFAQPAQLQIHKQRRRPTALRRVQQRRAFRQIRAHCLRRRVAQRDITLLLSFAMYQNRVVGPMNVVEIQSRQLGISNSAAIQQFKNRPVPCRPTRRILTHRVHHLVHLFNRRNARQMFRQLRRRYQRRRILFDVAGPCQPFEPAANRRQRPRRRGLRKPAVVERSQVSADVRVLNPLHTHTRTHTSVVSGPESSTHPRGKAV